MLLNCRFKNIFTQHFKFSKNDNLLRSLQTFLSFECVSYLNLNLPTGASKLTTDDKQPDLSVKTSDGQVLEFKWSSPTLSSICPDVNGMEAEGESNSSIPSTMVVSPPSISVKQILGPW